MAPSTNRKPRDPNYTRQETELLYKRYKDNYEEYHKKLEGGSRTSEGSKKERLLEEWSKELSSFGICKRTPDKIAEKLKKDIQICRGYLSKHRQETKRTGGGPPPKHPSDLYPQYKLIIDAIQSSAFITGITETETIDDLGEEIRRDDRVLDDTDELMEEHKNRDDIENKENIALDFGTEGFADVKIEVKPKSIYTPRRKPPLLQQFTRSGQHRHAVDDVSAARLRLLHEETEVAKAKKRLLNLKCQQTELEIRLLSMQNGIDVIPQIEETIEYEEEPDVITT